jgi:hemerythrin
MQERHYDEYEQHKSSHELLLDEIRDIMDAYEDDEIFDEDELSRRLDRWFTEHFRTFDARLHRHLPH